MINPQDKPTLDDLPETLRTLRGRPLFMMTVVVSDIQAAGGPPGAERRIANVSGGSFAGERLSGTILPGGIDWLTASGDGATLLDARLALRTDDGAVIGMEFSGIRHGSPDVIARVNAGEAVDPAAYYFRTLPRFTTSAPGYEWLNRILAVGVGQRLASGPVYSVFEIL
jgi:hypothetical protein